jgi:AraC family transcriptional activator of mtrCDE
MDVAEYGALEAPFHVLLDGECQLDIGDTSLSLRGGDVVLIPSGAPHRIVTTGDGRQGGVVEHTGDALISTRSENGRAPAIDLFCGHYTFDAGAGALLFRSFQSPVHVSFGQSEATDQALRMLSTLMRTEAQQQGEGTAAILAALSTVLLAMVLRTTQGSTANNLWTAPADGRIGQAIEAVFDDPGADWTIERLSHVTSMSRATFQRTFIRETGETPGAFLMRARLMAAAELLRTSDAIVAEVSRRVGYRSESSFSRAFRTHVGSTPAKFRRDHSRVRPVKVE